jgi:hypothetical protein
MVCNLCTVHYCLPVIIWLSLGVSSVKSVKNEIGTRSVSAWVKMDFFFSQNFLQFTDKLFRTWARMVSKWDEEKTWVGWLSGSNCVQVMQLQIICNVYTHLYAAHIECKLGLNVLRNRVYLYCTDIRVILFRLKFSEGHVSNTSLGKEF